MNNATIYRCLLTSDMLHLMFAIFLSSYGVSHISRLNLAWDLAKPEDLVYTYLYIILFNSHHLDNQQANRKAVLSYSGYSESSRPTLRA